MAAKDKSEKSNSDLIYTGILLLCGSVVEFAVLRYIEGVPEWLVGASVVTAILMAAIVSARPRLAAAIHPRVTPISLFILFLIYLIPIGYALYVTPTWGQKWEYHWADINWNTDWPGEDFDCSPGLIPSRALCNEEHKNVIAQCYNAGGFPATGGPAATKCNQIKAETGYVYCTYKRSEVFSLSIQPTGKEIGRAYLCANTQR